MKRKWRVIRVSVLPDKATARRLRRKGIVCISDTPFATKWLDALHDATYEPMTLTARFER